MTELTMKFTSHLREFTPSVVSSAHDAQAQWCQSKANSPADFRRCLEDAGIYIDPHTARSWYYGRTLMSTARVIELVAAGATDLPDKILGPAKALASTVILERKLEQAEQAAKAAAREAAELRNTLARLDSGCRR